MRIEIEIFMDEGDWDIYVRSEGCKTRHYSAYMMCSKRQKLFNRGKRGKKLDIAPPPYEIYEIIARFENMGRLTLVCAGFDHLIYALDTSIKHQTINTNFTELYDELVKFVATDSSFYEAQNKWKGILTTPKKRLSLVVEKVRQQEANAHFINSVVPQIQQTLGDQIKIDGIVQKHINYIPVYDNLVTMLLENN